MHAVDKTDRPLVIILSPPCTPFSLLQQLRGDPQVRCPNRWREAVQVLELAVALCELQIQLGGSLVFEHPQSATSWAQEDFKALKNKKDVFTATCHMCQFGMVSKD